MSNGKIGINLLILPKNKMEKLWKLEKNMKKNKYYIMI